MKKQTFAKTALILMVLGTVSWLFPASAVIGMVVTDGSFRLDQAQVTGSGTLFDGSRIETLTAPSQLRLQQGAQFRVGAAARALVYQHKLLLECGAVELESAPGYEVEAGTLHVSAEQPGAAARIAMRDARRLTVAGLRGAVRVTNSMGLLVAKVEAGTSLDFEPQAAGATAPTLASGCLLEKTGKFIIAEQTTNIVLELLGAGLAQELGNRVQITGRAVPSPGAGAAQIISVVSVQHLSKGGCSAIAKKLGARTGAAAEPASTTAGAAASPGIGAGTVAVIGGVAAAATVGGLAAVGSLPGQSDSPPAASR